MFSEVAISVTGLSKCYQIYDRPQDRLKQSIFSRLQKIYGHQSQYYREFWALNNVSFEVKKGETVGIIGRNGSGKSTLLQLICGTLSPTNGAVNVNGRVAALLELGSGFSPEFSGKENVYMNAALLGLSTEQINDRFEDIVAFADIGPFINQPVKTYSSGMMVRLAFAVIAHVDAEILIIDEALAVGDAFFTQKCMRFLRSFMKSGTVLFVSHDTASVRNLCSRAIWLEGGVVLQQGSPKEVSERYLEAFYEAEQGKGTTTLIKKQYIEDSKDHSIDSRLDFINRSNLRNDIALVEFDLNGPSFGDGGAQITSVNLLNKDGAKLSWIIGGENVIISIEVQAYTVLNSPIIGFFIKDRLGQTLFGDNTYLTYYDAPVKLKSNQKIKALFDFRMPRLARGDYSITVAIADGTQDQHVQHHWIHDAVLFKSESTSVAGGLIGVPMSQIKLYPL
jgi:lipopolysaccharide transport system ATP-binding protein